MAEVDVLKSYLIKIKHVVDEASRDKAMAEIDTTKSKLSNLFSIVTSSSVKAGAMILSTLISVNAAVGKTLIDAAKLDVETERMARNLWTSEKNARALQTSLDAVGSSFDEINYMTMEEFQRMMSLRNFGLSLEAPAEAQQTLKLLRDFVYLTDKLQVLLRYAGQWFVYYIGKYTGNDLIKLRNKASAFLDYLSNKLPVVMEKVSKFFYIFIRLGQVTIKIIVKLGEGLFWLLDRIPKKALAAGVGITAFLGMLKLGPVGLFIMALTTLLLLLEDYMTWQEGGKSLLGDKWQAMTNAFDDENSIFGKIKKTTGNIFDNVDAIKNTISKSLHPLKEMNDKFGLMEKSSNAIRTAFEVIGSVIEGSLEFINAALGMFNAGIPFILNPTDPNAKQGMIDWGSDTSSAFKNWLGDFLGIFGFGSNSTAEAERSTRGGGFAGLASNKTNNFTNNVTVNYSGGNQDPYTVGQRIGQGIFGSRPVTSAIR